jgi:hypothetical protein
VRTKKEHFGSAANGPPRASLIDLEAEMFVAIAILTVAAVIAVYAISLWIDTPTS